MPATYRPVVRSYKVPFVDNAVAHVKRGGHAVLWETPSRAKLVFQIPSPDNEEDFGAWSVYDMAKTRWHVETQGALKGLASLRVPRDCFWIVKRRCERDSAHRSSRRKVNFDCLECGACCRDNEVILNEDDLERFEEGGRADLTKAPYARKRGGKLVLTLLQNGRCRHLARDNKCRIYALRPKPCSEFPMGSECCIFAREDMLGLYDGIKSNIGPGDN